MTTTLTTSRYIQYLPAIFQKPPTEESPEVALERLLLPFEQEMAQIEDLLAIIDRHFSPALLDAQQVEEFLPWLATWVALLLDEEWDEDKRRRLISEAVQLYRWRGTAFGLKRFLEIYTGLDPSAIHICDGRWPGGMQIGVASRIGRVIAPDNNGQSAKVCRAGVEIVRHDYYRVETVAPVALPPGVALPALPAGTRLQLDFCADREAKPGYVEKVQIEADGVRLWYRISHESAAMELAFPRPPEMTIPNISRHSEWTDYCYTRLGNGSAPTHQSTTYHGGAFLVETVEQPYRFIVEIHESATGTPQTPEQQQRRLAKIERILDLERPAHTEYALKFKSTRPQAVRHWMQIEVRSSIGLDTLVR